MLTYEIKVACARSSTVMTLTVYANSKDDAFKIAEAYLLTQGYGVPRVRSYTFHGAAPQGAKVGIKPRQQDKAEDYLKGLDFGELEQRVLAYAEGKLGNLYADMAATAGVSRQAMKEAVLKRCYTTEPLHFSPPRAIFAEPCKWTPRPEEEPAESLYERAKFTDGRGYINLYPRKDSFVQAGNVYTTRCGAQAAAKYPDNVTTTLITWDTAPKVQHAPEGWPLNFNNLQSGQIVHLQHRLRAWAGLPDQNAAVKVYANPQVPGGYINMTVGSPSWRACLDALRQWLTQQGLEVRHRRGTTTVIEVKWADLAPRVWPL